MKVIIYRWMDSEDVECQRMTIDGKKSAYVGHPEPEDAIIGRDLISCVKIAGLMKKAHEAGVLGEAFELSEEDDEEG